MKPDQYEIEAHRWKILLDALDPRLALREMTTSKEQERVQKARGEHDAATSVAPKWYAGPVRDLKLTDNEGWYEDDPTGGFKVKTLDKGHWLVDEWEKVRNNKALLSYVGKWQHMKILRPDLFYFGPTTTLIGANGWELAPGTYMFVICRDGALRYFPNDDSYCEPPEDGKHYVQYLPHAALACHEPVLAAGNFGVATEGKIAWAASNSGHYRVDDRMCQHNLLACLRAHGYAYNASEVYDANELELLAIDAGQQTLRFFRFPSWRYVQTQAKKGMEVLHEVRPKSNVVTAMIAQTLEALDQRKIQVDSVRDRISSPTKNVVFESIGNDKL
jgi:hypothetical protein